MNTQRHRIIAMLTEAGSDGVCSWAFYRAYMPHASSRIPELNAIGYRITGETKDWGDGHGTHSHYFLRGVPAPEQLLVGVA